MQIFSIFKAGAIIISLSILATYSLAAPIPVDVRLSVCPIYLVGKPTGNVKGPDATVEAEEPIGNVWEVKVERRNPTGNVEVYAEAEELVRDEHLKAKLTS
ncbi:hypothetical protein GYMLUDRAFT_239620 [Collybiopsis luxurians FD-317 M1]|nr:hypothetical protein GYMLUDRAFT_239620 [Collybiopsis luxurians FD-317 M1]